MDLFEQALRNIGNWVWGPILIGLLIGTGFYFTIILRGIQFRYLIFAFRLVLTRAKTKGKGDITPFQSLMTALAATIGTGNIAGVATAVMTGGIGALFWMWVSGLVGMALKYSEAILGVRFRITNKRGRMAGGPMYYIERGLGWKWLAVLWAIFGVLASFGIGNTVQAHSIVDVLSSTTGLHPVWSGILLAWLIGLVILGGIQSIGKVTGVLVPAMAIFYITGGIVILILRYAAIPEALSLIFESAFTGQAAAGGFLGATAMMAVRFGVARGLFSNEAGMGSASIAAAAAKTDQPGRQALIAMSGTFIDTLVVCTITGLVLAVTGVVGATDASGEPLNGAPLTAYAFGSVLPGGRLMVTIGLILFAYSTILGWAYYGEKCIEYLFGLRARIPYRLFFILVILVGAVLPLEAVWAFGDIANGLMALPNLIALIALSGVITSETQLYLSRVKSEKASL